MFSTSRIDEPRPIQVVDPNSSFLLADSEQRDYSRDPNPADFSIDLGNSASGARRIIYRNLQWTQPLYSHNLSDWELRISFSDTSFATSYSCFVTPWYIFRHFAGETEDLEDFAVPDARYYCAMLEEALKTGLRLTSAPLTVSVPALASRMRVRYSRYQGLCIIMDQTGLPSSAYFRIEPCSWLNRGHNLHGFGVQKEVSPDRYEYQMEANLYATGVNTYFSAAVPNGNYTRFISVVSKEASRNRKITSFTNLRKGGRINATEMTTLPIIFQNTSSLQNYLTVEDPTVVNLRPGDSLQHLRLQVVDEGGEIIQTGLLSGNPSELYHSYIRQLGGTPSFSLDGIFYDPTHANPVYSNNLVTAILTDLASTTSFFNKNQFINARMDLSTSIVHYCQMVMFSA